jgi:hypothetical protein
MPGACAWRLTWRRDTTATDEEVQTGLSFMDDMKQKHGLDARKALDRFALLVMNLNEFVYLD